MRGLLVELAELTAGSSLVLFGFVVTYRAVSCGVWPWRCVRLVVAGVLLLAGLIVIRFVLVT